MYSTQYDWWEHLEHSELREREGHKYYIRVPDGVDRRGHTQYRYFYDAREYGAWKTRQQKAANTPSKWDDRNKKSKQKKAKGRTTFLTGWGYEKLPTKASIEYDRQAFTPTKLRNGQSTRGEHISGRDTEDVFTNMLTGKKKVVRDSIRSVSVKTVKNKKKRKKLTERGKEIIAKLFKKKK